jgi:multiple sugar transport system ATP-binding protein
MNMIEATVTRANGGLAVDVGQQHLKLDDAVLERSPALRGYEGRTIILGIRPEDLEEASLEQDTPPDRRLQGVAELREALGSELMVHFTVEGTQEALTEDVKELAQDTGAPGGGPALESEGSGALLVGRFGARASVAEGKSVEVAVDTRSLHFFDPETSGWRRSQESSQYSWPLRPAAEEEAAARARPLRGTRACRDPSSSGASGPRTSRRRSRR